MCSLSLIVKKPFSNFEGLKNLLEIENKKIIVFNTSHQEDIRKIEHSNKKFFRFFYYRKLKNEIIKFKKTHNLDNKFDQQFLYLDEDGYFSLFIFNLFRKAKKIIVQHGFLTKKNPQITKETVKTSLQKNDYQNEKIRLFVISK